MQIIKKALVLALLATSNPASSSEASKGWFFYKEPQPIVEVPVELPEKKQEEKIVEKKQEIVEQKPQIVTIQPSASSKEAPKNGSVQWYKEELERLTNIAIEEPTEENMLNYIVFQKIAADKSSVFADKYVDVYKKYPQLYAGNPTTQAAVTFEKTLSEKTQEDTFLSLSDKVSLFFFFKSDCPYCHKMAEGTMTVLKNKGFHVKGISIDGMGMMGTDFDAFGKYEEATEEQLREINVSTVPAVYMFAPEKGLGAVTVGLTVYNDFRERALLVAREMEVISGEDYDKTTYAPEKNNVFKGSGVKDDKSSEELIDEVKERLKIRGY